MQRGIFLIILAAIFWGTTGFSARTINDVYPLSPLAIGAWRLLLASPVLILISILNQDSKQPVKKEHLPVFLIYGIAVAAYQLSFFSAVTMAMVSSATLIAICTSPVFAALLAKVFLKDKISPKVLLALLLSICGTVLIMNVSAFNFQLNARESLGYLLALVAGLSYASYLVAGKSLLTYYSPLCIISITFSLGAIFMLPFIKIPTGAPSIVWSTLLFLAIVPTALAYILYTIGLKTTNATSAAIASLFEPLTATFLALWIIGESLSLMQIVGAVLLFSALFITTVEKKA